MKLLPSQKEELEKIRNRHNLKSYQNNIVLFIGELTHQKRAAGQYQLVKNIKIIKFITESYEKKVYVAQKVLEADHLWIDEKIIANKLEKKENRILAFGEIEIYSRRDGSEAYGIIPLVKLQYKNAYLKYYLYRLRAEQNNPQKYYKERKALKKLIDESWKILREVMEDESSQGKMFKHLLDIDILDAIASYIYKYQTELKQYDKNRKNRQKLKRKKVKGFAKIN